ncbi:hypothetical protein JCM1840_001987 [Sporobolomyces johnsonii]
MSPQRVDSNSGLFIAAIVVPASVLLILSLAAWWYYRRLRRLVTDLKARESRLAAAERGASIPFSSLAKLPGEARVVSADEDHSREATGTTLSSGSKSGGAHERRQSIADEATRPVDQGLGSYDGYAFGLAELARLELDAADVELGPSRERWKGYEAMPSEEPMTDGELSGSSAGTAQKASLATRSSSSLPPPLDYEPQLPYRRSPRSTGTHSRMSFRASLNKNSASDSSDPPSGVAIGLNGRRVLSRRRRPASSAESTYASLKAKTRRSLRSGEGTGSAGGAEPSTVPPAPPKPLRTRRLKSQFGVGAGEDKSDHDADESDSIRDSEQDGRVERSPSIGLALYDPRPPYYTRPLSPPSSPELPPSSSGSAIKLIPLAKMTSAAAFSTRLSPQTRTPVGANRSSGPIHTVASPGVGYSSDTSGSSASAHPHLPQIPSGSSLPPPPSPTRSLPANPLDSASHPLPITDSPLASPEYLPISASATGAPTFRPSPLAGTPLALSPVSSGGEQTATLCSPLTARAGSLPALSSGDGSGPAEGEGARTSSGQRQPAKRTSGEARIGRPEDPRSTGSVFHELDEALETPNAKRGRDSSFGARGLEVDQPVSLSLHDDHRFSAYSSADLYVDSGGVAPLPFDPATPSLSQCYYDAEEQLSTPATPYWIDGMELPSKFCPSSSTRPVRSPLLAPIPVAPPKPLPAVSSPSPPFPAFYPSATPVRPQPAPTQYPPNPVDTLQPQPQHRASPSSASPTSQQSNHSPPASIFLEHLTSSPPADGLESIERARTLAKDESEELASRLGHGHDGCQGEGEVQLPHPYERVLPWFMEGKRMDSKGSLVSDRPPAGGRGTGGGTGRLHNLLPTNPDSSCASSFDTTTTISHHSARRSGSPVESTRRGPLVPRRASSGGIWRRLGLRSVDSFEA